MQKIRTQNAFDYRCRSLFFFKAHTHSRTHALWLAWCARFQRSSFSSMHARIVRCSLEFGRNGSNFAIQFACGVYIIARITRKRVRVHTADHQNTVWYVDDDDDDVLVSFHSSIFVCLPHGYSDYWILYVFMWCIVCIVVHWLRASIKLWFISH